MKDTTSKKKSPKIKKSQVEDQVWDLWNGYDGYSDDEPMSEWGTSWFDHLEPKSDPGAKDLIDRLVKLVSERLNVVQEIVLDILNSVYHFRECTCYDEREVARKVKDWTKKLHRSIGKSGGKEEYEFLKGVMEDILTRSEKTYDPDWDRRDLPSASSEDFQKNMVPRLRAKEQWEHAQWDEIVTRTGIPRDECNCLFHFGRIARLDKTEDDRKYQKDRQETYERLLQEVKHMVTLPKV